MLFPAVFADFSTITETLTSLSQNVSSVAINFEARNTFDPREITDFTSSLLQNINNYGCWCYFDADKIGKGRSQPMNEVDQLCRNLHYGYECAKIDEEDSLISLTGEESCIPWQKDYQVSTEFDEELIQKSENEREK